LSEDVVCRIVALKQAHPHWGPRKIKVLYERAHKGHDAPSESSFKRVLEKAGLVDKRVARRPAHEAGRIQSRRAASAPNEVWTVDFKGWWHAADGRRCEPLTIRDAHSRFVLCAEPLERATTTAVRARFEQVFATYGMPQVIRSDNGPPFASPNGLLGLSALSAWWLAVGISLDRIDPGRPDQNGSHERMHRDMALELQARARGDLDQQRAALSIWREEYNTTRPHEVLGMRTPAELYTSSPAHPSSSATARALPRAASRAAEPSSSIAPRSSCPRRCAAGTWACAPSKTHAWACGLATCAWAPSTPRHKALRPPRRPWKCRPDGQPGEANSGFPRLPTGLGKPGKLPPGFPHSHRRCE
jgi:transposase InsO family protein